jgi:hypothetical protein
VLYTLTAEKVFHHYKANSPFSGETCFADYLNQSLRDEIELGEPWIEAAFLLDNIIAKSYLQETTVLYRATIDAFVNRYLAGTELIYPAYMSTSTDVSSVGRHFATAFRGIPAAFLKIECAAGLPALDMETEECFGGHEHEILLPRRFEIRFAIR